MSSLVERLRVRSERRPVYNLDESDEEFDYKHKKPGSTQEIYERLERDDKVCLLSYFFLIQGLVVFFCHISI